LTRQRFLEERCKTFHTGCFCCCCRHRIYTS
jgi:hypothetical protein